MRVHEPVWILLVASAIGAQVGGLGAAARRGGDGGALAGLGWSGFARGGRALLAWGPATALVDPTAFMLEAVAGVVLAAGFVQTPRRVCVAWAAAVFFLAGGFVAERLGGLASWLYAASAFSRFKEAPGLPTTLL